MACGCTSNSTIGTYNALSGRPTCPLPARTSTPPTVPQRFDQLPRLVPKESGGLLMRNGDEMNVLDSPVDGVVLFDSSAGKVYVGDFEVTQIPDNYGCVDETLFGWPAYGLQPPCASSTEFPARQVAFMRPGTSSTGTLWAHQRSCGGIGGPPQELRPVEIVPDVLPTPIPAGIINLSVVKTAASECGSTQYHFYLNDQTIVANGNLQTFTFPARPLVPADDKDFRISIYAKLDNDRFQEKSITNASFQAYIDTRIAAQFSTGGFAPTYLTPRQSLVSQTSNEIFNYIYGPFDLSQYPGYSANSKEVQLWISSVALIPGGGTLRYSFSVKINGVEKYRSFAGEDPTGCHATGEVHIPIPANKLLMIEVIKQIYATGPSGPPSLGNIDVYLEAFK